MKPLQLLLTVILIGAFYLSADAQRNIRVGVRAGLNASTTSSGFGTGTSFKDPNYRLGSALGLLVNIPLVARLSFQPELNISSEGSVQDGQAIGAASGSYTQIFELKTRYLNIPFMLQYKGNAKGVYLEAGPQLSTLLKSTLLTKIAIAGFPAETDVKSFFNSSVISAAIGGGFNFTKGIGLGVRYTFGLSNASEEPEIKNSTVFLGLHVKL
ncbi:MAG: hypothetical protein RL732_1520 [Bacteroidota bacterium]